jgi:hypothetical protein
MKHQLDAVLPFIGLGDVRLGSTRSNVRKLLGPGARTFLKSPDTPPVDAYNDLGLHLYYDGNDHLEYIEAFRPRRPTYQHIDFFNQDRVTVIEAMAREGRRCTSDYGSYTFDDAGIALYAPHDSVEAVGVFRRGYYDDS